MSIDWIKAIVRQTIPVACLAPIERWLLTRLFTTEEKHNCLCLYGVWSLDDFYQSELCPDEELAEALAASREICLELCAEVEREMDKNGKIVLGAINYGRLFHSILRRHPECRNHISIEEHDCNSRSGVTRETLRMITPQCIYWMNSEGRSGVDPTSPYIYPLEMENL
jgi:hypothetical protein